MQLLLCLIHPFGTFDSKTESLLAIAD